MTNFISSDFRKYIEILIRNNVLSNLNNIDFKRIIDMLETLINIIAIKFNFDLSKPELYIYQLKQNNNRDIYAIFNLLFPYIDDKEGSFTLHKEIYNIKDIIIKKVKDPALVKGFIEKTNTHNTDNITVNPYLITNLQFNKYIDNTKYINKHLLYQHQHKLNKSDNKIETDDDNYNNYDNNDVITDNQYFIEYKLSINNILNNFYILLNSIDQIANKLYVNWINIRPIINYKTSNLYKKTFKYDEKEDDFYTIINNNKVYFDWYNPIIPNLDGDPDIDLINNEDLKYYQGLSCGDIYNMIHHELYYGIKDFKWLIYDLPKDSSYKDYNNFWELFINLFNKLDLFIEKNEDFDDIQNMNPEVISEWINIKNNLINQISDVVIKKLIYNILYFLQRKYRDKFSLESSGYINLPINKDKKENDDENDTFLDNLDETYIIEITDTMIIESWSSLDIKILYKYIQETIERFKKTWYGYNIITLKKSIPFDAKDNIKLNNGIIHKVSYKNIYNFSKALLLHVFKTNQKRNAVHVVDDISNLMYYKQYTWANLGTINLNDNGKESNQNILDKYFLLHKYKFIRAIRTTSNTKSKWFSMINTIKTHLYPTLDKRNIDKLITNIYKVIRKNIIDISFECLFIRGTLNEFIPDRDCTDKQILSTDFDISKGRRINAIRNNIFNKSNVEGYKKCYYYLTNEPYNDLPLIIKKNEKPVTYLESLETGTWYTFYAMDWISQICFFHRYINNRIMFITGATGAGKSSQVPKLLLYGLKMIDFNSGGKVVSTQPRISPTISNANEISEQMGVSINSYSKTLDTNIKTFMGYVQYKTMNNAHLAENYDYYFKEMTDGSLVSELHKNPLLKMKRATDKNDPFDDKIDFTLYNLYDIIIIDESHEHNKYMDIILTLMKYAIFWNNSLKLVIISATMVDDEPIYRRFYKDINDNMMFPLSLHNANSVYNGYSKTDEWFSLDKTSVDRRIHISPPGETTQHKVIDNYLEFDTKDYAEAEILGVQKVFELLDYKISGDILFFTLGEAQIRKIVEELNAKSPSHVIALPFYSTLPEYWRDLAEKTNKIKDFTILKKDLFKEIDLSGSAAKVPPRTYTQVIVVATNVAEASITIINLKHVIETGYFNSVTYDSLAKTTIAIVAPITEASRIQRRGRVGRVAGGTVWYMYAKGARSEIKPTFSICASDIKTDIFNMMRKNHDECLLIDNRYNIFNLVKGCKPNVLLDNLENINNSENTEILMNIVNYYVNIKKTYEVINKDKPKECDKITWNSVHKFLSYQYLIHTLDGKKYNLLYFGDEKLQYGTDFELNAYKIPNRYLSGYNVTTLVDLIGTFHLIHPSENLAYRHIITGYIDNRSNNEINKFNGDFIKKSFSNISSMFYSRMIIPTRPKINNEIGLLTKTNEELLNYTVDPTLSAMYNEYTDEIQTYTLTCNNKNIKYYVNDIFDKTLFAYKLLAIYDRLDLSDSSLKDENLKRGCITAVIYGMLFGITDEVCMTVASIFSFGSEMKELIPQDMVNNFKKFNLNKNPINQFKNNYGDIITLFNIFKKFKEDFRYLSIWDLHKNINVDINNPVQYAKDKTIYTDLKKDITTKNKNNDKNTWDIQFTKGFTYNDFLLLQKIDQKNNLDEKIGKKEYTKEKKSKIKTNISESDANEIIEWCLNRNIAYDKIVSMIRIYLKLMNSIKIDESDSIFDWFKENIKVKREPIIEENILKCFLYGFIDNVCINIPKQFDSTIQHIISKKKMQLKKIYPVSTVTDTTIQLNKYLFYLTNISDKKTGEVYPINLNNINVEWLFEILPDVYNNKNINMNNIELNTYYREFYLDIINGFNKSYFETSVPSKYHLVTIEDKKDKKDKKEYNNILLYYSNYLQIYNKN